MKIFITLSVLLILGTSCSSPTRDPASVERDKEQSHQKYQGLFDKQD
jgi:hypothetical protein